MAARVFVIPKINAIKITCVYTVVIPIYRIGSNSSSWWLYI